MPDDPDYEQWRAVCGLPDIGPEVRRERLRMEVNRCADDIYRKLSVVFDSAVGDIDRTIRKFKEAHR